MSDILEFCGQHRWLSNFFPCRVFLDGVDGAFPSTENAYQAAKYGTKCSFMYRFQLCSPGLAKRWGKYAPLSDDWNIRRLVVMEGLLRQKFNQPYFKELLLLTSDRQIFEGNMFGDTFWGVCDGRGENHLGKLIMKIRGELNV